MPRRLTDAPPTFIDRLNKWLIAIQAVAVIGGVIVAVQTLRTTQATQSATLILDLRKTLSSSDYKAITRAIQENDQKYPLRIDFHGIFSDTDIEDYIGNFEDIGFLIKESPVLADMAYDHFSYDVEKAWCNQDVQKVIAEARRTDKSVTAVSDPWYGDFEKLARSYLRKEHQTCDNLDKQ